MFVLSAWISAAEIGIISLSNYNVKKLVAKIKKFPKFYYRSLTSLLSILIVNIIACISYVVEEAAAIIASFTLLIFERSYSQVFYRLKLQMPILMS
jgi:hypothetical protein